MSILDVEDTSNTLFGNIKKSAKKKENSLAVVPEAEFQQQTKKIIRKKSEKVSKFTVFISEEHKDSLESIAKRAMRNRTKQTDPTVRRERITSNTILRALLQNFISREHLLDDEVIQHEVDAIKWLENIFCTTKIEKLKNELVAEEK